MKKLNIVAAGLIAGGAIVTAAVMPGKGSIATSGNSTLIATPGGVVTVTPVNNDIFRISSIKQERGTSYPFARSFSFALSLTL